MKFSALLSLVVVLLIACHKEDTSPSCGCEAKPYRELVNEKVAYLGGGYFIGPHGNSRTFFRLCDTTLIDPAWKADTAVMGATGQIDTTKFVFRITGQLKAECSPPGATSFFPEVSVFTALRIVRE
ncbi:hypothetical protein [Tellurirhabdus bombi]|uniref:hypothetical protein n=1 Tax=Tellurirhabdus bombi TaxID=2907205 RepID=UPI001F2FA5F4|nr:hypothetical protein [Tellurirhabdus bombi]